MNNLTTLQNKLVKELIAEFEKLNPKPKETNGSKRFSIDTIGHCINEEERIRKTVIKHNSTMAKVFLGQLNDDIKAFKKEFGKLFDFQIGYRSTNGHMNYGLEEFEKRVQQLHGGNEMKAFIVSKKKRRNGGRDEYDYCNGMDWVSLYINFKTQVEKVVMESGKEVVLYRIVGLKFSNYDYCNSYSSKVETSTLDELIQTVKHYQERMVEMSR